MRQLIWKKQSQSFVAKVGKRHRLIATYQGPGVYTADVFIPDEGIWTVGAAETPDRAVRLLEPLGTVKAINAYLEERKRARRVKR